MTAFSLKRFLLFDKGRIILPYFGCSFYTLHSCFGPTKECLDQPDPHCCWNNCGHIFIVRGVRSNNLAAAKWDVLYVPPAKFGSVFSFSTVLTKKGFSKKGLNYGIPRPCASTLLRWTMKSASIYYCALLRGWAGVHTIFSGDKLSLNCKTTPSTCATSSGGPHCSLRCQRLWFPLLFFFLFLLPSLPHSYFNFSQDLIFAI